MECVCVLCVFCCICEFRTHYEHCPADEKKMRERDEILKSQKEESVMHAPVMIERVVKKKEERRGKLKRSWCGASG